MMKRVFTVVHNDGTCAVERIVSELPFISLVCGFFVMKPADVKLRTPTCPACWRALDWPGDPPIPRKARELPEIVNPVRKARAL